MKIKVALTADELQDVIDSAVNEAMDRGYDGLEVNELTDDMCHIVDAALTAMGIEVIENEEDDDDWDAYDDDGEWENAEDNAPWYGDEDDEEEEEEIDPIEEMVYESDGKRVISKADADELLHIFVGIIIADNSIPNDKKWDTATKLFIGFCEERGIEGVDMGD
jgi:hypothetical protein